MKVYLTTAGPGSWKTPAQGLSFSESRVGAALCRSENVLVKAEEMKAEVPEIGIGFETFKANWEEFRGKEAAYEGCICCGLGELFWPGSRHRWVLRGVL